MKRDKSSIDEFYEYFILYNRFIYIENQLRINSISFNLYKNQLIFEKKDSLSWLPFNNLKGTAVFIFDFLFTYLFHSLNIRLNSRMAKFLYPFLGRTTSVVCHEDRI